MRRSTHKNMSKTVQLGSVKFGNHRPFVLIAGPCVVEDRQTTFKIASFLKKTTQKLKMPFVFKASYDKANRTSIDSFRGRGMKEGLTILGEIKKELQIPVTTDVHTIED